MKAEVLGALRRAKGAYVSGEGLSESLSVSRTAIWKAVGALKEDGYPIESHRRKGYRLVASDLRMTEEELTLVLSPYGIRQVLFRESVGSTNDEAKDMAKKSASLPAVVIAEEQTAGKGRRGRQWLSPKGEGLFLSLAFAPRVPPEKAASLTHLAAEATRRALAESTGAPIGVKWPNDLVLGGRKIAGILTELSAELGAINHVVVGIGLNLHQTSFPGDLDRVATSLAKEGYALSSRVALVEGIVGHFFTLLATYEGTQSLAFLLPVLREHSVTLGRGVRLIEPGGERAVQAQEIDDEGALIVENASGEKERIYFGEVSVRGLAGYT